MLGVIRQALPGQQDYPGGAFPLAYRSESEGAGLTDAIAWVRDNARAHLSEASAHGAVLFRGFPLRSLEDFDLLVSAFDLPGFAYDDSLSNAVRVNHSKRVFSANEAPPEATINLHHEMAQTPLYPSRLFFYCQKPAEVGGATSICRSDILWERLLVEAPKFATACREKGLRYRHTMPEVEDPDSGMGRSWKSTFSASNRAEASERMLELGYTGEWLDDGCLRVTSPPLPAVRELGGGRTAFFNQLIAAFTGWRDRRNTPEASILHGDGTPLDVAGAELAASLGEQLSFDVVWEPGDMVLIDNLVTMHGRRTFQGTRSVLASFAA
ncbi:MAG: TauD/TfdA family dioxygenase [Myxococcota bacterium]|nr:TauD/TfdA family dioxygenase [Myxococcota bacterium]